ncbi:PEP-utilizing enzyme [Haliangium sp. UPWRP_2]|uniref:PEP-utilizing enzyme n=1 Tax=Haliangium sp. UPWRP_2 TaxID=1931276 RepID=UPI000B53A0A9|nr:PEP-utilizing enzyme [Haliangium sp. UPWRP_2]PSM31854.1 hypothetical protein BVG81_003220 [Haliangium sp. UPWRP_2]
MSLIFTPPGPGTWELDSTHFPRPAAPATQAIFSRCFPAGMARATARYGLVLDTLAYAAVNGWLYNQVRIVAAPPGAPVPPKLVLQLLTRLHPEYRRRAKAAQQTFAQRLWREDIARWQHEQKPARRQAHLRLLRVPIVELDDAALLSHIDECLKVYAESTELHGYLSVPAFLAVGDFIVHVQEWSGRSPAELVAALASTSPVSAGDEPERRTLLAALQEDGAARSLLEAEEDPGIILERLRASQSSVGACTGSYLDAVGYRTLNSYDLSDPYALEYPFILVAGLRSLLSAPERSRSSGAEAVRERLRDAVPSVHRSAYDALFAEAELSSSLRDERVLYNDYWSAGITRRAFLEAGRRLVERSALVRAEHATACSRDELGALLASAKPLPFPAAEKRFTARRSASLAEPPAHLGPTPIPPPPTAWLPPALRRVQRATLACLAAVFEDGPPAGAVTLVRGISASPGRYEGTARIVTGPAQFDKLRAGDVLVARSTSPTYNVVLPMLGALVTDRGGALSHAAIVSREFGIPGVVGCRDATQRIPDGARVRVDGSAGECMVLP